jgi:hypothetical protein
MKLFNSSLNSYAIAFRQHEYILAKGVISESFLRFAATQLANCRSFGHNELSALEIKSKKKQYLFDLPANGDILGELIQAISGLTDTPVERMTVSERHIMIYDEHANPLPPLHKDRLASRFSIGIPLEPSSDARIMLLSQGARDQNLLDRAVYCPRSAHTRSGDKLKPDEDERAEICDLPGRVELDAQPGDAVIFAGSSIFHGRSNASRSSILYFKVSDLRLDPLCEDPATVPQRNTSLDILQHASDQSLLETQLELSPRLQHISRVYTRSHWAVVLRASVSGESDFTISEHELNLLFRIRGRQRVSEILDASSAQSSPSCSDLTSVRRLVQLGAIDLLD